MLQLGTVVKPYGKVIAIAFIGGERYYFMRDGSSIAMMPADFIEALSTN
jgi:hypothetical protein